jgi:hypothetical protein
MRITELLEGKQFNDLDFVKKGEDGEGIDFDLTEDLVYYMNHDDDIYRRHVYPSVAKCLDRIKSNRETSPSLFTNAVKESYKNYIKKFPIRHLPEEIEDEICKEVCEKIHEDLHQHHGDGKYED